MGWSEIKEISSFEFVHIGNHSHTHDYLVDKSDKEIEDDLKNQFKFLKKNLIMKLNFLHIHLVNTKTPILKLLKI